ncbi:MAG TPA: type VI secretion system-associated FHA domain protein TagH [Gammaproteobacteria bacterium]
MALRLQIISRHRQGLGDRAAMEFGQNGGTIGRSLESDWVLPDSQRYLSSRHASIDFRSGSYYIVDTSTNGVYVNDSEQPVGRGNPQRLFTGDRIRIGEYEMSVEISGVDDTRETLLNDGHIDPVSKAQRVPPPDPTRADMVSPHEITAVGIEMLISDEVDVADVRRINKANAANLRLEDEFEQTKPHAHVPKKPRAKPSEPPPEAPADGIEVEESFSGIVVEELVAELEDEAPARRAEPPPVSAAARIAPPAPKQSPVAPAAPPPPPAPAVASAPSLDAFFRGAGMSPQRLDERQTEQVLQCLGQIMRELVLGISENLHVRAEQKNLLRVPTTTIQPQNNNPLKFSASVEEALDNLLFRESAQYLSAVDAVREGFGDIKQHQHHLLAAMRTAVVDYIGRLEPEQLENKVGRGLLGAANKLKYWDLFKDLFQVVAQCEPGQFPHQFIEELARAYELEAARSAPPAANRQAKIG